MFAESYIFWRGSGTFKLKSWHLFLYILKFFLATFKEEKLNNRHLLIPSYFFKKAKCTLIFKICHKIGRQINMGMHKNIRYLDCLESFRMIVTDNVLCFQFMVQIRANVLIDL